MMIARHGKALIALLLLLGSAPPGAGARSAANAVERQAAEAPKGATAIEQALSWEVRHYVSASPDGRWVLLQARRGRPSVQDLQRPAQSIGGYDVLEDSNRERRPAYGEYDAPRVYDIRSKRAHRLNFPSGSYGRAIWSPLGDRFIVSRDSGNSTELWLGTASQQTAAAVPNVRLNASRVLGGFYKYIPCSWYASGQQVVCLGVPDGRGKPPQAKVTGVPEIIDSVPSEGSRAVGIELGRLEGSRLDTAHKRDLYNYYMTAQPLLVDVTSLKSRAVGRTGIYDQLVPSPDGRYILSSRIVGPYPYFLLDSRFPRVHEVLDPDGNVIRVLSESGADLSGTDDDLFVGSGPRAYSWKPTADSTLIFFEAEEGGADILQLLPAPFRRSITIFRSEHRLALYPARVLWAEADEMIIQEYSYRDRLHRTWLLREGESGPKLLISEKRSTRTTTSFGEPVTRLGSVSGKEWKEEALNNSAQLLQDGRWIYLRGELPNSTGMFLDRLNLDSTKRERLWVSSKPTPQEMISSLNAKGTHLLIGERTTSGQSGFAILNRISGNRQMLLAALPRHTLDPLHSRIDYRRDDGVRLTGHLYLPRDCKNCQGLPVIMTGYPMSYASVEAAESARESSSDIARPQPHDPITLTTQGYAVFVAPMPLIGAKDTYDSASKQLIMNAEAALLALRGIKFVDTDRMGIAGHSFGGFMVASLLADTRIFKAGASFSGMFDFSLAPFGTQDERRNFWAATLTYDNLSPYRRAHNIDAPLLLIHGTADESHSAKHIQSQRMYEALYGLGKRARFVSFPGEYHTLTAKENVLRAQSEMLQWFDEFLRPERIAAKLRSTG